MSDRKFERLGEPDGLRLINDPQRCEELRARELPIVPSAVCEEEHVNPFLRTRLPAVARVARAHHAAPPDAFTTPWHWKNEFK